VCVCVCVCVRGDGLVHDCLVELLPQGRRLLNVAAKKTHWLQMSVSVCVFREAAAGPSTVHCQNKHMGCVKECVCWVCVCRYVLFKLLL